MRKIITAGALALVAAGFAAAAPGSAASSPHRIKVYVPESVRG